MISFKELYKYFKFYFFLRKKIKIKKKSDSKSLILIEYFRYKASIIPFYYFSTILQKKYNSTLMLYLPNFPSKKLFFFINFEKLIFFSLYNLYKLFGVEGIILPKEKKYKHKFYSVYSNIKLKKDILNIKIDQILIGDLIYDDFLRSNDYVTLDYKSDKFKTHLEKSISLFYFWKNFLKKNKVQSIINSHNTYLIGLLPRIGVSLKIPVYKVGPSNAYKTDKKHLYTFDDRKNSKKYFKLLPKKIQKKYLSLSEKNLLSQFIGKKPNNDFIERIINIKKTNKTKILIASHCFNDAVHIYGNFIFNDFHEWIEYLAKFSKKTDYEWIVKIHPSEFDRNIKKMIKYKNKFSNLRILPKNYTNVEVLKLGITAVLTVYGTVGREYPIFNIPVINASTQNPHSEFNFNYHINSVKSYEKILKNINKLKINPYKCKKDIFEYYSMKYSNYNIIDEFRTKILKTKYRNIKFKEEIEDNVLENWSAQFNLERDHQIKKDILNFINSKQIRMIADNTSGSSKYLKT